MEKLERIAKYAVRFLLREGTLEFRAIEKDIEFLARLHEHRRTIRKAKEIETTAGIWEIPRNIVRFANFGSLRAIAAPKVVFPSEDVKSSGCISSTL
jgi:hypothetical protein